jgi:hypothetical protein
MASAIVKNGNLFREIYLSFKRYSPIKLNDIFQELYEVYRPLVLIYFQGFYCLCVMIGISYSSVGLVVTSVLSMGCLLAL